MREQARWAKATAEGKGNIAQGKCIDHAIAQGDSPGKGNNLRQQLNAAAPGNSPKQRQ